MWKQKLIYGNTYAAIELAEDKSFYILLLSQKKAGLEIEQKKKLNSLEESIEFLKGQKHVFVIFNNEQVLSKSISNTDIRKDEKMMVRSAFPNISLSDFYFQSYKSKEQSFVAIIRKEVVENVITTFKNESISVIDFSLGNLVVENLAGIFEEQELYTSNAIIIFEENKLKSITKESVKAQDYAINGLELSNTFVLGLSGILSYYTKRTRSTIQKKLYDGFFQNQIFNLGVKVGLGFLLTSLLINFFIFSSYRNKVGDLSAELQMSSLYKTQLLKLQDQVSQKKQLVESVLTASTSKVSKDLDQIGMTVPETLLLTSIQYQPREGVLKQDKPLVFNKNRIVVTGESKDNDSFSKWISSLEQLDWVKDVSIVAYGRGTKRDNIASFEFLIQTHD